MEAISNSFFLALGLVMEKEIVVMVGNIGAGKSTYAKELKNKGYVVLCRDSLRYAIGAGDYTWKLEYEPVIFSAERHMLRQFCKLGVNIVIDEVGVSKRMRKKYIQIGKEYGYDLTAIVMPRYDIDFSVKRRLQDPHGHFSKETWEEIWTRFDLVYSEPTKKEGFDRIIKKRIPKDVKREYSQSLGN